MKYVTAERYFLFSGFAVSRKKKLVDIFPNMVASVIGFFAIEIMCSRSVDATEAAGASNSSAAVTTAVAGSGAFSVLEIAQLWEVVCQRLDEFLGAQALQLNSPDEVLQLKEQLLLMAETVADEAIGLKQHGLFESMRKLWDRFKQLQLDWIAGECVEALDHSAYQPLSVDTEESFQRLVKAYRLDTVQVPDGQQPAGDQGNGNSRNSSDAAGRQGIAAANLDALEADLNNSNHASDHGFSGNAVPFSSGQATGNSKNDGDEQDSSDGGVGEDESDDDGDFGDVIEGTDFLDAGTRISNGGDEFVARIFPFSGAVPRTMHSLHMLVLRFFLFAHRNPHLSGCGEAVCSAVSCAYEVLGARLMQETVVDGSDTPLSKACQISIDAATFAAVSDTLWEIIENALNHFRYLPFYWSRVVVFDGPLLNVALGGASRFIHIFQMQYPIPKCI
jgi:hypothetical protein